MSVTTKSESHKQKHWYINPNKKFNSFISSFKANYHLLNCAKGLVIRILNGTRQTLWYMYLHNRNSKSWVTGMGKPPGMLWHCQFYSCDSQLFSVTTVYHPPLKVHIPSLDVSNLYCNGTLNLLPHLTSPVTILFLSRRKFHPRTSWFSSLLSQR